MFTLISTPAFRGYIDEVNTRVAVASAAFARGRQARLMDGYDPIGFCFTKPIQEEEYTEIAFTTVVIDLYRQILNAL